MARMVKESGPTLARSLRMERLESRRVLDGTVTVNFSGNDLRIEGDNNDNDIAIFQTEDGRTVVVGLNGTQLRTTGRGSRTTGSADPDAVPNSGDETSVVVTGNRRVRNISVNLKGGNDSVSVFGDASDANVGANPGRILTAALPGLAGLEADLTEAFEEAGLEGAEDGIDFTTGAGVRNTFTVEDLKINMGTGDDTVLIENVNIGDELEIKTDRGADFVDINLAVVREELEIDTGNDDDEVRLSDVTLRDDGEVEIKTGNGNDQILIQGLVGAEEVKIESGNSLTNGRNGGDVVRITGLEAEELEIKTGNGNDTVVLEDLDIEEELKISTNNGNDFVSLNNVFSTEDDDLEIEIKLGSGNDLVLLANIFADETEVDGGSGNDSAFFFNVNGELKFKSVENRTRTESEEELDDVIIPGRNETVGDFLDELATPESFDELLLERIDELFGAEAV